MSGARLCGSQFAAGEGPDSNGSKNSAQQENDLRNSQTELTPGDAAACAQGIHRRKAFDQVDNVEESPEHRDNCEVDPIFSPFAGLVIEAHNASLRNYGRERSARKSDNQQSA